jgi:hypothetical protein
VIGVLEELPPEPMLHAQAHVDDEALRALANARARAVKDAIAAKGVPVQRLLLVAPRSGPDAGTAAARGNEAAVPRRPGGVELALR